MSRIINHLFRILPKLTIFSHIFELYTNWQLYIISCEYFSKYLRCSQAFIAFSRNVISKKIYSNCFQNYTNFSLFNEFNTNWKLNSLHFLFSRFTKHFPNYTNSFDVHFEFSDFFEVSNKSYFRPYAVIAFFGTTWVMYTIYNFFGHFYSALKLVFRHLVLILH